MGRRDKTIARSIIYAVLHSEVKKSSFIKRLPAYFYIYWLNLQCLRLDIFNALREAWAVDDVTYRGSFDARNNKKNALSPMGDMGFSGSTFFVTQDSAYLVKSIPRHFEHSFFRDDLLGPYAEYMLKTPDSLLVRITDLLACAQHSIGSLFGFAPSHHIVMENILYGQEDDQRGNDGQSWQSWDLKPMSYFYPERDVAGGVLTSESTKGKLADNIDETICLTLDQAEAFKAQLEKDTALLAKCNAVDYSLFLVRIPLSSARSPDLGNTLSTTESANAPIPPAKPPFVPPRPPSWRTGVKSADGQYLYRAAILDFFWAKHKVHAMAMTGLINTYNVIDRQGPMSVTTTSPEYRQRFLGMCYDIIQAQSEAGPSTPSRN